MGRLKGHRRTRHWEISGWAHSLTHFAHNVCLHGDCMDDWTIGGPNSFHSLMAQWEPLPLEGCQLSPSWCFLEEAGLSWWPKALPSICPTWNTVFHGVLEHMVSGPNGLVGSVFCADFSGLFAKIYYVNYNGDTLDTYSDCVKGHFKRSKWGFYTWVLELPVGHLEMFSSCNFWHHYREVLIYNLQHDSQIPCSRLKKNKRKSWKVWWRILTNLLNPWPLKYFNFHSVIFSLLTLPH